MLGFDKYKSYEKEDLISVPKPLSEPQKKILGECGALITTETDIQFIPNYPEMIKEIKHEIGLSLFDPEDEYEEGANFLAEAIDQIINKYEKGEDK
jgi:hypothetical protein